MKIRFFIFLIISLFLTDLYSQTSQAIEFIPHYGKVFQMNDFLKGNRTGKPIDRVKTLSIRYIIHTDGSKDWHQLYNYLDYGVGFNFSTYNEPVHLGNSYSLYAFIYSPIIKWKKFTLKNDLAIGLSYVEKHWSVHNIENNVIGSSLNCYIQEGFVLEYLASNRFLIGLGFNFSHISNGSMKKPNLGINTFSSQINLRYNFYDNEVRYNHEKPEFDKGYDILLSSFGAIYNDRVELYYQDFHDPERYPERYFYAFGLNTTAYKNLNYKNNLGLGLTLGYDDLADNHFMNVNGILVSTTAPFFNRLNLSAFASYEYKINRFSAFAELGHYLIRKTTPLSNPNFFQRVGVRYLVYDNLLASVAIRATSFKKANYIEWGLGYRFKLVK